MRAEPARALGLAYAPKRLFEPGRCSACLSRLAVSLLLVLSLSTIVPGWKAPAAFCQELDGSVHVGQSARAPLVWDNVTDGESWCSGPRPRHSPRFRCSVVELPPGSSSEILVPAWSLVRVQVCAPRGFDAAKLEVWATNGSGLFRRLPTFPIAGKKSVVAMPDSGELSIVRIVNPAGSDCPVTMAFHVSRRAERRLLDAYSCRLMGSATEVTVQTSRGDPALSYQRVAPNRSYETGARGNSRMRIEGRLLYGNDPPQRQTFWVRVFDGDRLLRVLNFDTVPQRGERVFVDECEVLLGRREFGYVDVPESCGPIRVVSSHPALLRIQAVGLDLCRPQINMPMELLQREDPYDVVSLWQSEEFDHGALALEQSFLAEDNQLAAVDLDPVLNPWLNQQRVVQIARDHRIPHGGLRAFMWMRVMALLHRGDFEFGDEVSVSELAARIRGFYTHFRNLMPDDTASQLKRRYFLERSVRRETDAPTNWVVGEPHLADAAGWLSAVGMAEVGTPTSPIRTYSVPRDLGDSLLRIVIDRSGMSCDARLMLQYDDRPPMELAVMRERTVPVDQWNTSLPEAALAALSMIHRRYDAGTLGGPFGLIRSPGRIYPCATAELLLPHGVQTIRLWLDSPDQGPLLVGLQYLDGRDIELSEASVRSLYEMVGQGGVEAMDDAWTLRELQNDRVPFEKWVMTQTLLMDDSVQPSPQMQTPTELWDETRLADSSRRAQAAANDGQWPAAIEALSEIIQHSTGEPRRLAILARINALESAGEAYLAENERRGWWKFGDDESLRNAILSDVLNSDRPDRWERAEMWLAWITASSTSDDLEQLLAEALVNNGRFRYALLLLWQRSEDPNLHELLMRAAYQVGWWDLFDEVAGRMEDQSAADVWRALRAMRDGQYRRAHELLKGAGPAGKDWLAHWQQGHLIYQRLREANAAVRREAVAQWSAWWNESPGPRQWTPDETDVVAAAGVREVKSILRDLRGAHYVASPTSPVRVRVFGPGTIRLALRPLHGPDYSGPVDDWISISSGDHLSGEVVYSEMVPVIDNAPSRTLVMTADARTIGAAEFVEIELAEGMNELAIQPQTNDLLVRLERQVPEIVLPVLPILNQETVAAALAGRWVPRHDVQEANARRFEPQIQMVYVDPACTSCPVPWIDWEWSTDELCQVDSPFEPLAEPTRTSDSLESSEAFALENDDGQLGLPAESPSWDRPIATPIAIIGRDELLRRAIDLYRQFVADARSPLGQSERHLAALYELVARARGRADLRSLRDAAARDWTWQKLEQFDARAGFSRVPIEGWQPETPGLRIRRSMLPDDVGDAVLVGDSRIEMNLEDVDPIQLRVSMQRLGPGFVRLGPLVGQLVVDGESPQSIVLDQNQSATIGLALEPGRHGLAVAIENPMANHFVGLAIQEKASDEGWVSFDARRPWPLQRYRTWQVATDQQPLVVTLSGPRVVRIDWIDAGSVRSEIQVLEDGSQTLHLLHRTEGEQTLYRLFELVPGDRSTQIHRPMAIAEPVPEPWVDAVVQAAYETTAVPDTAREPESIGLAHPDMPAPAIEIEDAQWLAAQHLGTWSLGLGYRQRRPLDEFPNLGVPGRFFFGRLARDYYDATKDVYRHDEFEVRPRIEAGTTFGFRHGESMTLNLNRPRVPSRIAGWSDWGFDWDVYGFVQNAGTPRDPAASASPWLVGANAQFKRTRRWTEQLATYRVFTIFAREMSEDVNGFGAGDLDQDVFTTYKHNHRAGLRWSDQWVYQGCLDRRYWVRPLVASNEDEWIPDHASVQLGADQLLGPLQLQLAYRWTSFFADNNRSRTSFQNLLDVRVTLEQWINRRSRSELAFSMRYDIDQRDASLLLSLTRFMNAARGYRDLDSVPFRAIRQARAVQYYHSPNR